MLALASHAKAQADWNFIGRWKDSTTQHLLPCSLKFQYPYLECKEKYSDGKEEYDWSFVKDDFIQMSFKKIIIVVLEIVGWSLENGV